MTEAAIEGQLDRFERRLLRVERHLGLAAQEESRSAPAGANHPGDLPRAPAPMPPASLRNSPAPTSADMVLPLKEPAEDLYARLQREKLAARGGEKHVFISPVPPLLPTARAVATPAQPPPLPPLAPPPAVLRYQPKPPPTRTKIASSSQTGLEQLIGLKWAGWVGAIVLVIGAALGIKYAYAQGWFPTVPPSLRLIMLYVGGFALIAAGEWVYRRINTISATGLFGAGVATLFVVSYAGFGYYQLYERDTAFALMAASTLIGAAVAMRGNLVSIAVLSLIGGSLAPALLQSDVPRLVPFLSYLLMLQIVALMLAGWGGSAKWWMLRGLSLASTALWVAAWMMKYATAPWGAALWFSLLFAALYQFEVILSTHRRRGTREVVDDNAGVLFATLVTACLTGVVLGLFRHSTPLVRGQWVVAISAAIAALGFTLAHFSRRIATFRPLAYTYRVQAAVLVLLAVPIAFSGATISLAWAAMAIAAAAIGSKFADRVAKVLGVAAWGLSVVNFGLWFGDPKQGEIVHKVWLHVLRHDLQAWAFYAWGLGVCGHAVAWFIAGGEVKDLAFNWKFMARFVSGVASAMIAIAILAALPPLGATCALIGYAWLLFGFDALSTRLAMLPQALAILALAAAKWAVVDTLANRLSPGWNANQYAPIANPMMLTGILLAGSISAMYWLKRAAINTFIREPHQPDAPRAMLFMLATFVLVMTFGLSFEIDRIVEQAPALAWPKWQLKNLSWTVLWLIGGLAYFGGSVLLDRDILLRPRFRKDGWLLVGLLVAKFIIIDTLAWWVSGTQSMVTPVANAQVFTALALVAALVLMQLILRPGENADSATISIRVGLLVALVLLWTGTLEIERIIAAGLLPGAAVWSDGQLKQMAWTAWWSIGACAFLGFATWRDATSVRRMPIVRMVSAAPIALALKFAMIDTLAWRLFKSPAGAMVLANLQTLTGMIVLSSLVYVRHFLERDREGSAAIRSLSIFSAAAAVSLLLWCGTLEIDRAFERSATLIAMFHDPETAKQVAFSIFWSAFAIVAVASGFATRTAGLRYLGLALFALTLAKVAVIDLRHAETGYRILSTMGLGGLLLLTSVVYGKLSPRLLGNERPANNAASPS